MARVLVVDDEPGLRMTLAANLELEGFEVQEASSGEEALALVQDQPFDLVMTDIKMPGMSGVDLFRRLTGLPNRVPVVLMTGFAVEELVQGALEEGAFTVLSKPFDVTHALSVASQAARRPTVLVVDDAEAVSQTIVAALQSAGVPATSVSSGAQAVEAFEKNEIDVCVIDMVLPDESGPSIVSRLRQLDPGVLVIAISGHDVPDLVRQLATMGMQTFLPKPFRAEELIRAIAVARGRRQVV